MDFLGKAFLGSDKKAHAVPGTAAAFLAVIQADPAGPYGAKARDGLTTLGLVWPDWDGQIPTVPKPSTNPRPVYSPLPTSGPSVAQAAAAEEPQPAPLLRQDQQQAPKTIGRSDIIAMLENAKSKKVKGGGYNIKHCNKNDFSDSSGDTGSGCASRGRHDSQGQR